MTRLPAKPLKRRAGGAPRGWGRDFAVVGLGLAIMALVFSCVAGCISPLTEEELADCRQDLTCWSDKHWTTAADECEPLVVRSAPGRHRWDIGIRVPMFDKVAWRDEAAGVVLYEGRRIRFRSASGEWRQMRYRCVHDPKARKTTLLSIEPYYEPS